ncbi:MAG TPA: hypothetical protein DHW02_07620 [Ktedonobacter sp.]|nr:hypothetical protein [Ktedonobacter sp.]
MSTLIIGVLFVVALVAIVGLVFVLRSERRPEQVKTQETSPQLVPADVSAAALEQEVPTNEALPVLPAQPVPQTSQASDEREEPTVPVVHQDSATSTIYDGTYTPPTSEVRVRLNGQFYELANSLRDLRQQASDMEQRLNVLTEMIDSIERKQGAHGE